MKPKIIYLSYLPLIQKREDDFYMNDLIQAGTFVEYWDLTKIFFPNIKFTYEVERNYIKRFHNYAEFENTILEQDIRKCFFIILMGFHARTIKLYRMLTKYNCYLIFFARTGIPVFSINESLLRKVVTNYRNYLKIDKIKRKFFHEIAKISKQIGLIKNYDLVFTAGTIDELRYNHTSTVVPVNHFDYDNYLCLKADYDHIVTYEYCVFLDDNLAYDTDFKILNIESVEPIPYFKSLCTFFDSLEKKFNLKVVIAAHPKAEYQGTEFGNREIIKGKTNELVKDSHFTIAHYSTSISYAILYKKPIVFIYTNEMKALFYFKTINGFAHLLNANIFNIDSRSLEHNVNGIKIKNIDDSKYENYKYKYLTSKLLENELSYSVFLQNMNKLINVRKIISI